MAVLFRTRNEASKPPSCEHCHEPMRCLRIERDKVFWRCQFCHIMTYVYVRNTQVAIASDV